jgi:hypothetical protein
MSLFPILMFPVRDRRGFARLTIDACIDGLPVFPLSRIFFLGVKIDPARFHVKRIVAPCTSRLRNMSASHWRAGLFGKGPGVWKRKTRRRRVAAQISTMDEYVA